MRTAAALLLALVITLLPHAAHAGKRSMIPPGQEQQIREFVEAALAASRAAGELPTAVDERSSISIDRDRIRVILHPLDPSEQPLPQLLVFHPEALGEDAEELAAGVTLECGAPPITCSAATKAAWRPVARRLAGARDPVVEALWQVEETGVLALEEAEVQRVVWVDRGGVIAALLLAVAALLLARRHGSERPSKAELAILIALLLGFVVATESFTNLVPLHEHNSFVARSDCALDERCDDDPAGGAWTMTALHAYGLLLEWIPYRPAALARLSLAISVIMLTLVWALTRRLAIELGRREWASTAGLAAVAVLVSNPVFWRLSGAASFWPWSLGWILGAALAGLWAARACANEHRQERLAGALGWVLATLCLAFAAAGNLVCLTLGTGLVLAPLCWSRAWDRSRWSDALRRAAWIGPPAIAGFALLVANDYVRGFVGVFGSGGFDDSVTLRAMIYEFNPLLLDPQLVTPVWALAIVAALLLSLGMTARGLRRCSSTSTASVRRAGLQPLRLLAPLAYAYLVPAAFLGIAASEVIGSGYPSGFLNHHWELVFTAIAVGLGIAWLADLLERLRPSSARLRWAWVVPSTLTAAALLLAPHAREGWRMATGELVVERELVALERSFAALPEHDLLVVAPRILAPLTDKPTEWDPLEVVFPVGFYRYALRERGFEPGLVVDYERMPPLRPGERILLYVGSSLRSFQPHEIADGVVPDDLERPDVARLRNDWEIEPVHEFAISTAQHEAASQRLGADRVVEIELGYFWMKPRE
ncbi:MAG TPA: hypothetical protein VK034_07830 [Enhygromyxa sp.]|nr:hypothetical protein [Enhygromyxa sp.]